MLKVIRFKICPVVQRMTGWLEAKGLPDEFEYISLKHKPQWLLALSPNGLVPVLISGSGQVLFESDTIVEYLEEAYGPLNPDRIPEEKTVELAWNYLASKHYPVQCSAQRGRRKLRELFEQCCHLDLDRQGRVIEYHARTGRCDNC